MWNSKKSLYLTAVLTDLLAVLVIVICFLLPGFLGRFHTTGAESASYNNSILYTYYSCVPFVICALALLHKLLRNIRFEKTFLPVNVTLLRFISWCCFAVSLAAFIGGLFYFPLMLIAAVMAFVGLIVRAVKNVFSSAIELKDENDMTI